LGSASRRHPAVGGSTTYGVHAILRFSQLETRACRWRLNPSNFDTWPGYKQPVVSHLWRLSRGGYKGQSAVSPLHCSLKVSAKQFTSSIDSRRAATTMWLQLLVVPQTLNTGRRNVPHTTSHGSEPRDAYSCQSWDLLSITTSSSSYRVGNRFDAHNRSVDRRRLRNAQDRSSV